jgi:hypothetical protein
MARIHNLFVKDPLFESCPACREFNFLRRSRGRNLKEKAVKKLTFLRIYSCRKCGWRGYISIVRFPSIPISFLIFSAAIIILCVLIVIGLLKFARL